MRMEEQWSDGGIGYNEDAGHLLEGKQPLQSHK